MRLPFLQRPSCPCLHGLPTTPPADYSAGLPLQGVSHKREGRDNLGLRRFLLLWVILLLSPVSAAGQSPSAVYQINCAGSAAAPFSADQFYTGGSLASVGSAIDTSHAAHPAPQAVYQTVRYGTSFSYAFPSLTPGSAYTVRLHFSENYWTQPGGRIFDVGINGTLVLTDFDVFAACGGQYKADVEQFTATADSSGNITVNFSPSTVGSDHNAVIAGIEVLTGALTPPGPANLRAIGRNGHVDLTWTASPGAASYNLYRATTTGGEGSTPYQTGLTGTSFSDASVTNGTTYYYTLTAVTGSSESGPSSEAQALPYDPTGGGVIPPGALVWYKADALTGLSSGAAVPVWPDLSGHGNDATQVTAAAQPLWIASALGSLPAIRFDGSSSYFHLPAGFNDFSPGMTAFVVAKPTSDAFSARFFDLGNGQGQDNLVLYRNGSSNQLDYAVLLGGTGTFCSAAPLSDGQYQVVEVAQQPGTPGQSSSASLFNNGILLGSANVSVPNILLRSSNFLGKSNWGGDSLFQGEMAEVLLYNRALTSAERLTVESYLGQRYGLTVGNAPGAVYQINCAGSAVPPFAADQQYNGGSLASVSNVITTAGVAHAAPAAVYQTVRYGNNFSYTLPSLTPGSAYTVRLHFSENYWMQAGGRIFNVGINGTPVLTNFDVFAAAGGQYKADVEQFNAIADSSGTITVSFSPSSQGSDHNAVIAGIEVLTGASAARGPANLQAIGRNGHVDLTWSASSGATSYDLYRATVAGGEGTTPFRTGLMGTTFQDTAVTNGTSYFYRLTAINAAGESAPSNEAKATPLDLASGGGIPSGAVAWYRGDVVSALSDGGSISVWPDLSGHNNDALQASTGAQPAWAATGLGGQPSVHFNGSSTFLDAADAPSLNFTGDFTVSFVMAPTVWNGQSMGPLDKKQDDNSPGYTFLSNGNWPGQLDARLNAQNNFLSLAKITVGQADVWTFVRVGGVGRWYRGGLLDETGPVSASDLTNSTDLWLGRTHTWNGWFGGDIAEVICYNRALSAADLTQLHSYLGQRYGLSVGNSPGAVYQINSGGGAIPPFAADQQYAGGNISSVGNAVDTSHVTHPAPPGVYQSVRYDGGGFSYTFPSLTPGGAYTVRLHFSENYWGQANGRHFSVGINGTPALINYDIFAVAGGSYRAVTEEFNAVANSSGTIAVSFLPGTTGQDHTPMVSGIEVLTGPIVTKAPLHLIAQPGNTQIALSWNGALGAAAYTLKRSVTSGGPYLPIATGVTGTTYTDTTVSNGTTYYYVVTAVNTAGESPPSNEAAATPTGVVGTGIGLTGQYYSDSSLSALVTTRTDPYVDFDWGAGIPVPGMTNTNFSVRWTGQVQPRYSGAYTFTVRTDDGVRLWVNGQLLIDHWDSPTESSASITLVAGTKYDLKMEYWQGGGGTLASLAWSCAAQPKETIPQSLLYPDDPLALPPSDPIQLSTTPGNYSVKLAWSAFPGALYYNIYRATSPGEELLYVGSINATSFVDPGVSDASTTYYYQVAAVTADDITVKSHEASGHPATPTYALGGGGGATAIIFSPSGLSGTNNHGRVYLSWNPSQDVDGSGAAWYNVYRSTSPGQEVLYQVGLLSTNALDLNVSNGTTYYYQVTATTPFAESARTPELALPVLLPAPTGLGYTPGDGAATLAWNALPNTNYYEVWRNDYPNSLYYYQNYYHRVTVTTALTLPDSGLNVNQQYAYMVRGVNYAGSGTFTDPLLVTLLLNAPTNLHYTPGDGQATILWDAVPNADHYRIYRNDFPNSNFLYLNQYHVVADNVTATQISDGVLTVNQQYDYIVVAVNRGGDSPNSAPLPVTLTLAAPTNLSFTPGDGKAILTWNTVANADTYEVWRDDYPNSNFQYQNYYHFVGTTTASTLTDSGLNVNQQYNYMVRAVNHGGPGPYCDPLPVTLTLAAPQLQLLPGSNASDVRLGWSVAAGSDSYELWRNDAPNSPYQYQNYYHLIYSGTLLNYTDLGAQAGNLYAYEVRGTNHGGAGSFSNIVTITPLVVAGLDVTAIANALTVVAGQSTSSTIILRSPAAMTGTASLSVSGLPAGVTSWFSPSTPVLTAVPSWDTNRTDSTLYLYVAGSVVPGTYTLTVTGTLGDSTSTATITLVVTQASARRLREPGLPFKNRQIATRTLRGSQRLRAFSVTEYQPDKEGRL